MPIAMAPSLGLSTNVSPRPRHMADVMTIAKRPDKKTAGSISPVRPHRSATVKTAKPNADPSAARLPLRATSPDLSATMIAIPPIEVVLLIRTGLRLS